jgi:hypothetical protein
MATQFVGFKKTPVMAIKWFEYLHSPFANSLDPVLGRFIEGDILRPYDRTIPFFLLEFMQNFGDIVGVGDVVIFHEKPLFLAVYLIQRKRL